MPNKTEGSVIVDGGHAYVCGGNGKEERAYGGEAVTVPGDLELAWFVRCTYEHRDVFPFDPNHFLHATSAMILLNASCTHLPPNRFSCDPLTPTHFTPILCSKISVIRTSSTLPTHTVIFSISTATSVSCKCTRWVINADVGYDIDIPSVPWTELSVRTIALPNGQREA